MKFERRGIKPIFSFERLRKDPPSRPSTAENLTIYFILYGVHGTAVPYPTGLEMGGRR
jgi:hypothetical protein